MGGEPPEDEQKKEKQREQDKKGKQKEEKRENTEESEEVDDEWRVNEGRIKETKAWAEAKALAKKMKSQWKGHRTAIVRNLERAHDIPYSEEVEEAVLLAYGFSTKARVQIMKEEESIRATSIRNMCSQIALGKRAEFRRMFLEFTTGAYVAEDIDGHVLEDIIALCSLKFRPELSEEEMREIARCTKKCLIKEEPFRPENERMGTSSEESEDEEAPPVDPRELKTLADRIAKSPEKWMKSLQRGLLKKQELMTALSDFVISKPRRRATEEDKVMFKGMKKELKNLMEITECLLGKDEGKQTPHEREKDALNAVYRRMVILKIQVEQEWTVAISFMDKFRRQECENFEEILTEILANYEKEEDAKKTQNKAAGKISTNEEKKKELGNAAEKTSTKRRKRKSRMVGERMEVAKLRW